MEILAGYQNTAPFLSKLQAAADSNRDALGFFPKSVFEEFARRENLFVVIDRSNGDKEYVGHLLFECRFPRAHVRQVFIKPEYRKSGIGAKLISHLCDYLTTHGFTSIYARVADDLADANYFWEGQHFYVQRVERGGVTRGRQINVRCRELTSPQLFPTSGISVSNPLGLMGAASDEPPLFLLDLNVLFDLGPRRLRHDDAVRIFHAERMNLFRLAISGEIRAELQRTRKQGVTDPMESYINIYPSFPLIKREDVKPLVDNLAHLIFPDKPIDLLVSNDWSDVRHVATVIQHELAGLITSDGTVLAAAGKIRAQYGIDIVSPASFVLEESTFSRGNAEFETSGLSTLRLHEAATDDEPAVYDLLSKLGLTGSAIATGWVPRELHGAVARRYVVRDHNQIVGYITWSAKGAVNAVHARVAVDEAHGMAFNVARILMRYLLEQLARMGSQHVRVILAPRQSYLREVATGVGFRGTSDQNSLSKIVLGRVLTAENWGSCREELASSGGVKLPENIPSYAGPTQQISVLTPSGNRIHVSLDELESLISPALLCLPGRPAVITPVKREFSEPLLEHSRQLSFLPQLTASLFQERHYLSDPRTLRRFKRGGLVLFYESTKQGGRAAIIAIARIRRAYLKPANSLGTIDLEQSVLTPASLETIGQSELKTVTVFDNIFTLPRQVPMAFLKKIGCGEPNNLITTQSIDESQLREILREAFYLA